MTNRRLTTRNCRADTDGMTEALAGNPARTAPERHHWLNVFVGVLDDAFHLTEEEQFGVSVVSSRLLDSLNIPHRGVPATLPLPVVQEMHSGLYSMKLSRAAGLPPRPVRVATPEDSVVAVEVWRDALEGMILTAYPDLEAPDRLRLAKAVTDLLAAIGVPQRAASHFPPSVVSSYNKADFQ